MDTSPLELRRLLIYCLLCSVMYRLVYNTVGVAADV
jgi:hypothetical protein